jgi:hypothetical protein
MRWAVLLVGLAGGFGCATQRIDFSARVGHLTFDQAVIELGAPDKQARLTDGTVVAEWRTHRGQAAVYTTARGFYGAPGWPYYGSLSPTYYQPATPDYFLRLTFGPDGKLAAWKHYAR